jgi:carbamoyl-phosphate synthase large subunit
LNSAAVEQPNSLLDAKEIVEELGGLPIVIRPSFTLGGTGGGIVWNEDEFERKVLRGLELSPVHQVLIEESIFRLERVRAGTSSRQK